MQLTRPISGQQQPWSYLAPFVSEIRWFKRRKSQVRTHLSLINRPNSGRPISIFGMNRILAKCQKLESSGSPTVEKVMTFVLIQYRSVAEGLTDRRTSLLWLYQRLHGLLFYRAGNKILNIQYYTCNRHSAAVRENFHTGTYFPTALSDLR